MVGWWVLGAGWGVAGEGGGGGGGLQSREQSSGGLGHRSGRCAAGAEGRLTRQPASAVGVAEQQKRRDTLHSTRRNNGHTTHLTGDFPLKPRDDTPPREVTEHRGVRVRHIILPVGHKAAGIRGQRGDVCREEEEGRRRARSQF